MSTFVRLLPPTSTEETEHSTPVQTANVIVQNEPEFHDAPAREPFAEEQIRGLVRQVFLPGWPRPCRQVVFSPVECGSDIVSICVQVGETLAQEAAGVVCVVDAVASGPDAIEWEELTSSAGNEKRFGTLREQSQQLSPSLWFMPAQVFLGSNTNGFSTAWLRARLAELRLEFDYAVFRGPAAAAGSEATLLASACDGMVLILRANTTRRATAQRVKETLHSSNARLLGAVLSERTFPIPEAIYRRL